MNKGIVSRIQTVVDHLEISVSAFADEIGVQRSSMSHLLNGRNKPSLDFVMKLVDTYPEVDLYWLLKGEGGFPKKTDQTMATPASIIDEKLEESTTESSSESYSVKHLKSSNPSKEPYKIVMFYSDGTFETFHAKKD
ncbi:helix-turn-helix transcriptional regulator [Muricauda sp. 334s03]|uniref:Helix-turn-helix transcriptional regulator n=1 Tax=Flagellimonas yonaguniensis TaxID=3031325 RepID=A0ABT5Y1C3_9FLAO|nr:helix-turn-helix transcriptional regulator [[Muricauda] yonaguniensis]MDF0717245.1 helix-turn-helix transcriptional regulator [[Muricauda] yonaguniensis]